MTGAGDLDRRIRIERKVEGEKNEFGERIPTWGEHTTVAAERTDVADGEKFAAGQTGGFLRARFVVRSSQKTRDIGPADRLLEKVGGVFGDPWNIEGIKETREGRRRFLEITATRKAQGDG